MCRFLVIKSDQKFDPGAWIEPFADACAESREYQGHGWGAAWWQNGRWETRHTITPIWEDKLPDLPFTDLLLVHARSAFRDEGIRVENNMPFVKGNDAFVFNGELHGVKLNMTGRIGAEKIFNLIRGFNNGNPGAATGRAQEVLRRRSRGIRAMNWAVTEGRQVALGSYFSGEADYFSLHKHTASNRTVVCSVPLSTVRDWERLSSGTVEVIS
jgi:glutamine amidotransferase